MKPELSRKSRRGLGVALGAILFAVLLAGCSSKVGNPGAAKPEDQSFMAVFGRKQDARLAKMAQQSRREVAVRRIMAEPSLPEPDFAMPVQDVGPAASPTPSRVPRR